MTSYRYTMSDGVIIESEYPETARLAAMLHAEDMTNADYAMIIPEPETIEEEGEEEEPYTSPDDYPGTTKEDYTAAQADHYGGPHPTTYAQLRAYDDRAHAIKQHAWTAYERKQRGATSEEHARYHHLAIHLADHATSRQLIARDRLWNGSRLP